MIVKIWPIKADYASESGKVGGTEGLKNTLEYISDEAKVMINDNAQGAPVSIQDPDREVDLDQMENNAPRVLSYMSNENKIEGKYISGYLCKPENALAQFDAARAITLATADENREKEDGALAFHIVQSFPAGLDISNEEVHQCGIELCKKLNLHQAVICSHVHPAVDEKSGEIHGKCKHNHILINAYIHPEKLDPNHPNRLKYHNCKETYALLRQWNDEIAIEHGLPIIRNPDNERTYSWIEKDAQNKGLSWKERIRLDIESARNLSNNWNEFVSIMKRSGYDIRDTTHVTYTAPDGEHKARGSTLGKQYTKENLQLYWSLRNYSQRAVEEAIRDNEPSPLLKLAQNTKAELFVNIPIGNKSQDRQNLYYLPLKKKDLDRNTLDSYFDSKELYNITDESHKRIFTTTGAEIISCIEQLNAKENSIPLFGISPEEEYGEEQNKKQYYIYYKFINTNTKKPYRTSLYDETGRRRTTMELIFILAVTVLKKEDGLWDAPSVPEGHETDVLYADTNWKIQNMFDSMYLANSEGIESPEELNARLNAAGADYSRAKSALKKVTRAKGNMEPLHLAISDYNITRELAEHLFALPDGRDKVELLEEHNAVVQKYNNAKAVMYRYGVTEEHQVANFIERYDRISEDVKKLTECFEETKESYRTLRKLNHNLSLAQNAQYCYGPEYAHEQNCEQIKIARSQAKTEGDKKRLDDALKEIEEAYKQEHMDTPEWETDLKK